MNLEVQLASDFPLPDLLQLLNLSFENYVTPISFNPPQFLTMIRRGSVDLSVSRVLIYEGKQAGNCTDCMPRLAESTGGNGHRAEYARQRCGDAFHGKTDR